MLDFLPFLLENRPVVETITAFSENSDRSLWLSSLHRISYPLLTNMAKGELRKNMPVESIAADMQKRKEVTHLEALGRLIQDGIMSSHVHMIKGIPVDDGDAFH